MFESPNDLRYAVLLIGSAQQARLLFQTHVNEFRKSCVVQYFAPLRVKFTFQNGMTVTIQGSEFYPHVSCSNNFARYDLLTFHFSVNRESKSGRY